MNSGHPAKLLIKNNIKTALENILAMSEVIREYGFHEIKINFWMIKCL